MFNILHGDCETILKTTEKEKYKTCITSPPYWKLRDYNEENQIGTENTPEEFVDKLVNVFREVRRTICKDGTLWLNLGDSYCGGGGYWPDAPSNKAGSIQSKHKGTATFKRPVPPGYKPKDLAGIPWQVALALRKDGWYLRQDIIWSKTNCMPENVWDRPTRSHEYLFLLSKSRKYYYNPYPIMEPTVDGGKKNCRSVWEMPTATYKGAHSAVFPLSLPERCILASTEVGDTVLDPFSGSGTTGVAAIKNCRNFIGIDLHKTYVDLSRNRITDFEKSHLHLDKTMVSFGCNDEPAKNQFHSEIDGIR